MVKTDELRALNDEEIQKRENELNEELFNMRFQVATQQTTNYARIKQLRKQIARIKTIKNERKIGIRS